MSSGPSTPKRELDAPDPSHKRAREDDNDNDQRPFALKRQRVEDSPQPHNHTPPHQQDRENEIVSSTPPPPTSSNDLVDKTAITIRNAWVQKETRLELSSNVFKKQTELTPQIRTELVEAILNCCFALQLSFQVAHLAIQLVDRMFNKFRVSRQQMKVLVITCVLIASKVELSTPPCIGDLQQSLCPNVPHEQVIQMESVVLNTLLFDVNQPTCLQHAKWWLHVLNLTHNQPFVRLFRTLCILSATCVRMLDFPPSKIGTAICAAAHDIFSLTRPEMIEMIDKPCEECVQCLVALHTSHMSTLN